VANDEEARRAKAERLRKRIAQRQAAARAPDAEEHPEMLPGESPQEYVERRMREIERKRRSGGQ